MYVDNIYARQNVWASKNWNLKGLFDWEKHFVANYLTTVKNVLLIGAGGGRELFALDKLSMKVDAYECNQKLVDCGNLLLKESKSNTRITLISPSSCPENNQKYCAAIIGFGAYSLIQGRKNRIDFLKKIHDKLNPTSPILVSFILNRRSQITRTQKITFYTGKIFSRLSGDNLRDIEPGDTLTDHIFTSIDEIKQELKISGFKIDYICKDDEFPHLIGIKL